MSGKRIIYQNWITEIGYDPNFYDTFSLSKKMSKEFVSIDDLERDDSLKVDSENLKHKQKKLENLRKAMKRALDTLTDNEREFIVLFYYMGKTYREISEKSNKAIYRLEALHNRALKKLKIELADFVKESYKIKIKPVKKCPLCNSQYSHGINLLIKNRDKTDTWKSVIRQIKEKYKIRITSPQLLIGHEKYHMKQL